MIQGNYDTKQDTLVELIVFLVLHWHLSMGLMLSRVWVC